MKKYRWNKKKFAQNMFATLIVFAATFIWAVAAYNWIILGRG